MGNQKGKKEKFKIVMPKWRPVIKGKGKVKDKAKAKAKEKITSIRKGIIISFSIVIIASLVTTGYISLNYSKKALLDEADGNLASVAYESSKLIRAEVDGQREVLKAIANRSQIQSMDWEIQKADLLAIQEETTFEEFIMIDENKIGNYTDGSGVMMNDLE